MSQPAPQQPKPTAAQRMAHWAYRGLCAALRITDVRAVAACGRAVGYLVWMCSPARRRIVARNLRIAVDPMLRQDKLAPMVRRNMVRTTMNLFCSLKTGLMTDREMHRSIRVLGADTFREHGMGGHCVISCIPHAGNWEILARIRSQFPEVEHYGSMYRRMSNPLIEDMVYQSRTRYGCEMFSKEDGLRAVLRLARTGGLLGVLSDQFTNEGVYVPYFRKVTGVTPLPALLYNRCKGKGHLFAVYTRNTGLGKWDAVMDRIIEVPEGCTGMAQLTLLVNKALEKCQSENILDGFWMHHRWKATAEFIPKQEPADWQVAMAEPGLLPFRILVCMPQEFEEAVLLIPFLHALAASRPDAQVNVVCPGEQQAFWQGIGCVAYTATTDGAKPASAQLEEDEPYKDGPYDYLFMFSESKRVFRDLQRLGPLFTSGFTENPLARKKRAFRTHFTQWHFSAPRHRAEDYMALLAKRHGCAPQERTHAIPGYGNAEAAGTFISPFSTLGTADSWPVENWAELCSALGTPTLLALPQHRDAAQALADTLGLPCTIATPQDIRKHLGPNCRLYAVDGLLPQIAALCGTPCTVIMASRLPDRYAPMGTGHRTLNNHRPCHPCYRTACDQDSPCTAEISVAEVLGEDGV